MTREQLETVQLSAKMFASLEKGGHLQVHGNDKYGITKSACKKDRNSNWETTYTVTAPGQEPLQCQTFEELVELVKDIPFGDDEVPA